MTKGKINGLTPTLQRALAACAQFRETEGRYPTPAELADLLPPVAAFADPDPADPLQLRKLYTRPMRKESALRLIERLMAAGYLTPQTAPIMGLLLRADELLRTIHTTNGDRSRIEALRADIANTIGEQHVH